MVINRAHRLGQYRAHQRYSRLIIVNFLNYNDVEYIRSNAHKLRDFPNFGIDIDLPREIAEARKRLWPIYKKTRAKNPNSNVRIIYPTKLICDRHVIQDEFSDWYDVLGRNRLTSIQHIDFIDDSSLEIPQSHTATVSNELFDKSKNYQPHSVFTPVIQCNAIPPNGEYSSKSATCNIRDPAIHIKPNSVTASSQTDDKIIISDDSDLIEPTQCFPSYKSQSANIRSLSDTPVLNSQDVNTSQSVSSISASDKCVNVIRDDRSISSGPRGRRPRSPTRKTPQQNKQTTRRKKSISVPKK
ncbi:hypothetical protein ACF0H5_006417 [Mactra antiquata]